jgi:hypothetical protein
MEQLIASLWSNAASILKPYPELSCNFVGGCLSRDPPTPLSRSPLHRSANYVRSTGFAAAIATAASSCTPNVNRRNAISGQMGRIPRRFVETERAQLRRPFERQISPVKQRLDGTLHRHRE